MLISNSDNNNFKLGPSLDLTDTYLTVRGHKNSTTIDCAAITAITIKICPPSEEIHHSFAIFPDPTFHSLYSSIEICARGDFGEETIFYKGLKTKSVSSNQIDSMKPEFNLRHELAVQLSKVVENNIVYAWKAVRDKYDIDQTRILTDRFSELTELTALTIKPSSAFHDKRPWVIRKINPFTPEL